MSSLSFLEHGDSTRPPLLILHGLFGSGRNWGNIARKLANSYHVFALDLPNHGRSDWTDHTMDYPFMARAVANWMDEHAMPSATIIGHSMGGKTAMELSLLYPDRLESLVVVDIAPVSYQGREHASFIRAMLEVDISGADRRSEVEARLEDKITETMIRKFLMQNLIQDDANSGFRWQINLEILGQSLPDLMAFPLPDAVEPFTGPTFFLAGQSSDYVLPDYEGAIKRLFLDQQISRIPGGHWLHAESPELFLEHVMSFLDRHRR